MPRGWSQKGEALVWNRITNVNLKMLLILFVKFWGFISVVVGTFRVSHELFMILC